MTVKPTVLGYQRATGGAQSPDVVAGRRALVAYARREGYSLGEVFVESDPSRPSSALQALVDVVVRLELRVVVVPTVWDLGRTAWTQYATRRQIERAGARVDVADPEAVDREPSTGGLAATDDDQTPARASATPPNSPVRPHLERRVEVKHTVWTGRMDIPLSQPHATSQTRAAGLSLVARLDHVLLWQGNRLLAVLDRDRLRGWLRRPVAVLNQDDLSLFRTRRGRLQVLIDGVAVRLACPDAVQHLVSVV